MTAPAADPDADRDAPVQREVVLGSGEDAEVDVELARASTICLEFVPKDRERVRWVDAMQIWIDDAQGQQIDHRMIQVDGEKTFTWQRGFAPGTYRVRATTYEDGSRLKGEVEVRVPHASKEPITVQVPMHPRK